MVNRALAAPAVAGRMTGSSTGPAAGKSAVAISELRCIIVVRADRPDTYEFLRRRLPSSSLVIVDRRRADRRQVDRGVSLDRRHRERRQPLARSEREEWTRFGYYVMFEMDDDVDGHPR